MRKRWILVLLISALWLVFHFSARPVHLDLARVPRVVGVVNGPEVERARGVVLAHLVGENLPAVSVAVGRDGDVVWSEGFGYADLRTRLAVTPAHRFRVGAAVALAPAPDDDFPLVNMFRELIHDPETTYDPSARKVADRVTSYAPRFFSDPKYGMYVARVGGDVATPTELVRSGNDSADGMVALDGIVVAVVSNVSHAKTGVLAKRVAAVFAGN